MKVQHHSIGNVVLRLTLLGGLAFCCAFLFLKMAGALIKLL